MGWSDGEIPLSIPEKASGRFRQRSSGESAVVVRMLLRWSETRRGAQMHAVRKWVKSKSVKLGSAHSFTAPDWIQHSQTLMLYQSKTHPEARKRCFGTLSLSLLNAATHSSMPGPWCWTHPRQWIAPACLPRSIRRQPETSHPKPVIRTPWLAYLSSPVRKRLRLAIQ